MGQDFPRRVEGYDKVGIIGNGADLNPGQSVQVTSSTGPGAIRSISTYMWRGALGDYYQAAISIAVDGVTIISKAYRDLIGGDIRYTFILPDAANQVTSVPTVMARKMIKIPYKSQFQITLKNNGSGAISIYLGVEFEHGS